MSLVSPCYAHSTPPQHTPPVRSTATPPTHPCDHQNCQQTVPFACVCPAGTDSPSLDNREPCSRPRDRS